MKKLSKNLLITMLSCQGMFIVPMNGKAVENSKEQLFESTYQSELVSDSMESSEMITSDPTTSSDTTTTSISTEEISMSSSEEESKSQETENSIETNEKKEESSNFTQAKDSNYSFPSSVNNKGENLQKNLPEIEAMQQVQQFNKNIETTNEKTTSNTTSVQSEITKDENIHFPKNESVEKFIQEIGENAREIGTANDLYASVMIAQAILESASGQSQLAQAPNYNLFGIKGSFKGKHITFETQEDLGNGSYSTIQANFKKYDGYKDSLNDYAKLLKEGLTTDPYFYSGAWKSKTNNYQEATSFLTGRYATDSIYDKKLNDLIETYHLMDYDKEIAGPQLNKEGYILPVKSYTISSRFGHRDGEYHRGLDLAANHGEPIYAVKEGTIIKSEFHPSWGNYVVIEHSDGMTTLYAHQEMAVVHVGETIRQGQLIGYVGSTGNSTGPHLHIEFCLDNSLNQSRLVDPERILFK